jgi:hypothetical protein
VAYYEKAVDPVKPAIRFQWLFYLLVLLGMALVGGLVYAYLQGAFTG